MCSFAPQNCAVDNSGTNRKARTVRLRHIASSPLPGHFPARSLGSGPSCLAAGRWVRKGADVEGLSILETLLGELLLCFSAVSLASLQSGQSTCFVTFPQSLAFLAVDATSQADCLLVLGALAAPHQDVFLSTPASHRCGTDKGSVYEDWRSWKDIKQGFLEWGQRP